MSEEKVEKPAKFYPKLPDDIPVGVGSNLPFQGEFNGMPFRGSTVPFLKEDDPASVRPKQGVTGHAVVLDLSDAEDLKYYNKLFNLAYSGKVVVAKDDLTFDAARSRYVACVRWVEHYLYQAGAPRHG
jgi:hypothetical protein